MARITYPEGHPDLENYRMESQRHTNQQNDTHEILGKLTETHGRELQLNQLIILPQQLNRKLKPKLGVIMVSPLAVELIQLVVPRESSQPPQQQVAQQSGHHRFRPRGRQFKKKSGSSCSGSGSSSSSSSKVEFCGQCGRKHLTTQCVGVQGSCNNCGQYEHFARVSLDGSQHTAAPPQGRSGGSGRGRSFPIQQQRLGQPQNRPFQHPGPSRFGQSSQPQFTGPQYAQVNAMTREQAEGTTTGVIAGN
ncbi:hypothetical protein F511_16560 [Dorcoceras hygrometricum]|uniref:Uncharacterized protein n=1 Tax=Dorcoceras hygrometricum TaxID=472368 RepID=A0A2Z7ANP2_9LAMI|nr:hypothetical protein F511_16560 [Dorcoceras hygrometricum]